MKQQNSVQDQEIHGTPHKNTIAVNVLVIIYVIIGMEEISSVKIDA